MSQEKISKTITTETTCLPESIQSHGFVYEDHYKRIERLTAKFDGFSKEYFVSDYGANSAVLVVLDSYVLLVRQYRLLINRLSFEVPGGKVENEENPKDSAIRECMEETGVRVDNLKSLIEYDPDLEYTKNHTYVFYTEEIQNINPTEKKELKWVSLNKCLKMIENGIITDSLSIIAIMTYQLKHGVQVEL
jgi:ADP-ribose pyrophosphatase